MPTRLVITVLVLLGLIDPVIRCTWLWQNVNRVLYGLFDRRIGDGFTALWVHYEAIFFSLMAFPALFLCAMLMSGSSTSRLMVLLMILVLVCFHFSLVVSFFLGGGDSDKEL